MNTDEHRFQYNKCVSLEIVMMDAIGQSPNAVEPIKILIVDDNVSWRERLIWLIHSQSDIIVIGTATSGEEAITLVSSLQPDVLLMDIRLESDDDINSMEGLSAAQLIKTLYPNAQIIIMSAYIVLETVRLAFSFGVTDVISKFDFEVEELYSSIRRAFQNPRM